MIIGFKLDEITLDVKQNITGQDTKTYKISYRCSHSLTHPLRNIHVKKCTFIKE